VESNKVEKVRAESVEIPVTERGVGILKRIVVSKSMWELKHAERRCVKTCGLRGRQRLASGTR
jgi:hypothetical protein